ncbi:MAG: hypothetical protein HFH73_03740 [Lachnospiraceae bacterium]|nr:hypothetical protein [Lachnospiraceae bacterium]
MAEEKLRKKIAKMEKQIKELQIEADAVKECLQKTETNRDEYKSKYLQFKAIFQRQTATFYQYQGLSEQSKDALSGIFMGDSFEEFLACGVQPGNIDTLWEFSRNQALKGNLEDTAILEQIIAYFVRLYNGTNKSPILAFQKVAVGDSFDIDLHIRTQSSKAAGTISNILITGLTNAFTGETIKKSVVEVE